MIKPARLQKGSTIGVISPASFSGNRSDFRRACEYIESLGYNVVLGENINKTRGFTAGTPEERAADFNAMFRNDKVDAVFASMGGYGSGQIAGLIEYEVVRANPKIFCGYSDITYLHLALAAKADLITFHGPCFINFTQDYITEYTEKSCFNVMEKAEPAGKVELSDDKEKWTVVLSKGVAEAEITGGNLTLIRSTLGTPYEINTDGKILFFEDIDMEPWLIDEALLHLKNAGKLYNLAGVAIGECIDCEPSEYKPAFYSDVTTEDILEKYLLPLGVPVMYGLPFGHDRDIATLPLGVRCRLDCDKGEFSIIESAVI